MLKNILFKELKEKRILLIFGLALAFLPRITLLLLINAGIMPRVGWAANLFTFSWIFYIILALIFPILYTAPLFAGEVESKNLEFPLSMPHSREKIWATKVLSALLFINAVVVVFILVNPVLLDFKHATIYQFIFNNQPWFIIALLLPTFTFSAALLATSLFRQEAAAGAVGVIILVLCFLFIGLVLKLLAWDVNPVQLSIIMFSIIFLRVYLSRAVFLNAGLMDNLKGNFKSALSASLTPLTVLIILNVVVYLIALAPSKGSIESVRISGVTGDNRYLLIRKGYKNNSDCRMEMVSLQGKENIKLPVRYTSHALVSQDGTKALIIRGALNPGPVGKLLNIGRFNDHLIIDFKTGKTHKVVIEDPYEGIRVRPGWLDSKTIIAPACYYDNSLQSMVFDADVFNAKGERIYSARIPGPRIKRKPAFVWVLKGETFVVYGPFHQPESGSKTAIVQKVDYAKNRLVTVFEKKITPDNLISLPLQPISWNKRHLMFIRRLTDRNREIWIRDIKTGEERMPAEGFIHGRWLHYKDFLMIREVPQRGYGNETVSIYEAGSGKKIFSRKIHYASSIVFNPKSKRLVYVDRRTGPDKKSIYNELYSVDILAENPEPKMLMEWKKAYVWRVFWDKQNRIYFELGEKVLRIDSDGKREIIYE